MADDAGDHETHRESLLEKIQGKIHGHDSSSSSDSEDEKKPKPMPAPVVDEPVAAAPVVDAPVAAPPVVDAPAAVASSSGKSKIYRLFGREQPVHKVLGGGKPADVLLWRNKKISASVLSVATVIWVLFELLEYHLLTLVCHFLIFALVILFLWSNASTFIKKSPPRIPDVHIPENAVLEFASALRFEINRTLAVLREIASGKDLKKFIAVVAGLWVTSVIGSCVNFLTLIYILFVLLHTVPVLYEKYEDQVDTLAEKAASELKKHYAVVNEKVLSKIPRGLSRDKKMA